MRSSHYYQGRHQQYSNSASVPVGSYYPTTTATSHTGPLLAYDQVSASNENYLMQCQAWFAQQNLAMYPVQTLPQQQDNATQTEPAKNLYDLLGLKTPVQIDKQPDAKLSKENQKLAAELKRAEQKSKQLQARLQKAQLALFNEIRLNDLLANKMNVHAEKNKSKLATLKLKRAYYKFKLLHAREYQHKLRTELAVSKQNYTKELSERNGAMLAKYKTVTANYQILVVSMTELKELQKSMVEQNQQLKAKQENQKDQLRAQDFVIKKLKQANKTQSETAAAQHQKEMMALQVKLAEAQAVIAVRDQTIVEQKHTNDKLKKLTSNLLDQVKHQSADKIILSKLTATLANIPLVQKPNLDVNQKVEKLIELITELEFDIEELQADYEETENDCTAAQNKANIAEELLEKIIANPHAIEDESNKRLLSKLAWFKPKNPLQADVASLRLPSAGL